MSREQTARIKRLAADVFRVRTSKVRVRCGKGTARSWRDVEVICSDAERADMCAERFRLLMRIEGLCGTYWPDDGFSYPNEGLCLSLRVNGVRK